MIPNLDEIIVAGEKRSTGRKTCPSVTLSTTNPTWTGLEWNPDLYDYRPTKNRLRYGMKIKLLS
jgi:hypothetical protein